jgi:hypothetical protein
VRGIVASKIIDAFNTLFHSPFSIIVNCITAKMTGSKRKREQAKFYAVRQGHTPGIYYSWADCQEQMKGYKGAVSKYSTLIAVSAL